MEFIEYSHRHADAIIASDELLKERYNQLTGTIRDDRGRIIKRLYRAERKTYEKKDCF